MIPDGRSLSQRVRALADRDTARAKGARKSAAASLQDAQNYERDASVLYEAAKVVEAAGK